MITTYIDMDGVVSDFKSVFGKKFDKDRFRNEIHNNDLFVNLPLMEYAEEVVDMVIKATVRHNGRCAFLTSLGTPSDIDTQELIKIQKKEWIRKHFPEITPIFVVHKGLKKRFASPNSILIDDTIQNIYDWEEYHGISFHYHEDNFFTIKQDYENTMMNLSNLFEDGVIIRP